MIFDIDPVMLQAFMDALVVFILAIIAIFNKKRTDSAVITAQATAQTAITNQAMAVLETTGQDIRLRDASGNLVTNQVGSQYWLDAGYIGAEPDAATKAAYTDAVIAYNAAVKRAQELKEKYGTVNLNPKLAELVK